jgi:ABC-type dipeptide/oligopeptide/nickel transport system permease component
MVSYNPIWPQIRYVLPYTLHLTLAGMFIGCLIGIPVGVLTAVKRNSFWDYVGRLFSLGGLSVPSFILGILLMFVLAVKAQLLPTTGAEDATGVLQTLWYLVMPALTLGLIMSAYISRMARSAMLNILNEDYIRTARAKGLGFAAVVGKHAFKNSLIPVITVVGMYIGVLIADSVLAEIVFSRPGLGKLMVGAMASRDYTMLQSILVIYAGIIVVVNLLTDLTYALFDPRVKYR